MPAIAFLPWATEIEAVQIGRFRIEPYGLASANASLPAELAPALTTILESYSKKRQVDRASVALIRREGLAFTADISDDIAAAYFGFRTRFAFAALSRREFFTHRYWNADNTRLVIQAFSPEGAGSALVTARRRDGHTRIFVSKDNFRETRPRHVSSSFAIPTDIDLPLAIALKKAAAADAPAWVRIADAIRLFVGAKTDNDDIDLHTELVDTISAFSRLFGVWDEKATIDGFVSVLPAPKRDDEDEPLGPKAESDLVKRAVNVSNPIRHAWLADAYRLRGMYSHGDVTNPGYRPTWQAHEHLLLAATIFPLVVKAVLRDAGYYDFSADDHRVNEVFDTLATYDAFAPDPTPRPQLDDDTADEEGEPESPWRRVISDFHLRRLAKVLAAEFERAANQLIETDDDNTK